MDTITLANIFVPLSAAVTSFVIVSLYLFYSKDKWQNRTVNILWFYFICCIVNWSSILFYFYVPNVFVVLNSLVLFTFVAVQVLFYKILFSLTKVDAGERFSNFHFLVPAVLFLFLSILMLVTPYEYQLQSVLGQGRYTGGSYLFFVVSNSKMPIRLLFSVFYTVLSFARLHAYRKRVVHYSANYDKSSLQWVNTYLLLSISLIPIPLMGIILSRGEAAASVFLTVQNLLILFQYAFLCFHIVRQNYIYLDDRSLPNHSANLSTAIPEPETGQVVEQYARVKLTKAEFESYIAQSKPYLNSDLRLTDIAADLNTNRTYLSTFINGEYGVNFNRLINRYRLQELERIRQLCPSNGKSEKEIVEEVGFGSYKNYRRFISQKD